MTKTTAPLKIHVTAPSGAKSNLVGIRADAAILQLHGGGYTVAQTTDAMNARRRLIDNGEITVRGYTLVHLEGE